MSIDDHLLVDPAKDEHVLNEMAGYLQHVSGAVGVEVKSSDPIIEVLEKAVAPTLHILLEEQQESGFHEGFDVIGVYSTAEQAERAMRKIKDSACACGYKVEDHIGTALDSECRCQEPGDWDRSYSICERTLDEFDSKYGNEDPIMEVVDR